MKVLMIGLGSIGRRHLSNIKAKFGDDVEFLAYRKLGKPVEGSIRVFGDIGDALKEKPDAAFICNPTSMHVDSAIEAAKAGCHLFIEKPLSDSMKKVEELSRICKEKNLTVQVGFQFRFNPVLIALKKMIESSAVGNVLSAHVDMGEYLPDWHKNEDYRQSYAARKDLGGGVVLSQIHDIDYVYWFFGMPEKVHAVGGKLSGLEIDVEDTADILMKMKFRGMNLPVSIHMDYLQRPPVRTFRIIGTEGSIIADLIKNHIIIRKPDGKDEKRFFKFERNDMFMGEIEHFFDCVSKGSKTMVGLDDGINTLKIALSVKKEMAA